jgi:periplasmic copper chaperone A
MNARKVVLPLLSCLMLVLMLTACGGAPAPMSTSNTVVPTSATAVSGAAISVSGAWLRMPATMDTPAAGYLVVRNSGPADRLMSAVTDLATQVEMHQTTMSGGMMQMAPVQFITIPAGGQAELKPGGYHLMLIGLKRTLKAGEQATLNLTFEKAGLLFVAAQVRE